MRQRWDNLPQMNQLKYGTFYAIILDMGILQMLRVVALLGFSIYISWRLVKKSDYAGWVVILFYVPILNILAILYFVSIDWPIETKLKRYQEFFDNMPEELKKKTGSPEEFYNQGLNEESVCMQCESRIPVGQKNCPKCGWSYMDPS